VVEIHKYNAEDRAYLQNWLELILENILESKAAAESQKLSLFFSISTNFKKIIHRPFITPQRFSENSLVIGVVVHSITQAILVSSIVVKHIDSLLIDVEKKLNLDFEIDEELLSHFKIDFDKLKNNQEYHENKKSISGIIKVLYPHIDIILYKPNDLTVDAVWGILAVMLDNFANKKIAIIGCGNIGFKLALKLVESGSDVKIHRRDKNKGYLMEDAINCIKSDSCNASAKYHISSLEASKSCDVVIGASSGNEVINSEIVDNMSTDSILIDIGKGNINRNALNKALEVGISVFRGDITPALLGFTYQSQKSKDFVVKKMGRNILTSEITILSGGLLGKNGEFIVDDFKNPRIIYGVSDGAGNLKLDLNSNDLKQMNKLKKYIKEN
jgi:hypothetical protein